MLFRARIGLAAAALVAALTAVVVMAVSSLTVGAANRVVEGMVERAAATFPTLDSSRGADLVNDTARMAREDEFGDIFAKASVDEKRQAAFVAVQARNARLEQQGHKADLVAVLKEDGHVVSRDLNIGAMYDDDLKSKYPSVGKALDGIANKDVWSFDGHMYRVAAAPIRSRAGQIVGALLVGYVSSAKDANMDRSRLGAEVAYFLDGKVHASSFKKEGGESAEEKQLAQQLFEGSKWADPAVAGELTKPFMLKIGNEEYLGQAGPLPGNITKSKSGYVVLASLSAARAQAAPVQMWILLLGGIALLSAVGASVLTAMRFIQPLDAIEGGVTEVINGNRDYTFESPSQDFEGLANGLNVMVARLLGRPDPTDDDLGDSSAGSSNGGGRWQGELAVEQNATGPHATPETMALADEPESAYLQRVFNEYVSARQRSGEGVEGLALEGFTTKLKQNEAALVKKYNCRMVRFKVVVKGGQTTLKPVPIP